jgi:chromosome segregation ATPase
MQMTTRGAAVLSAAIVIAATVSSWRPAAAQAARSEDVLPALLTEVKGLRAAMEQMASGSTQAQLLVGRLQLQEGRVTSMIRRLDAVRDALATARREYGQIHGSLQMLQRDDTPGAPPQEENGDMLDGFKAQVAAAKANVDRLTAEEMQLTGDIAAEQQRWVAINQRLDELERALAKR